MIGRTLAAVAASLALLLGLPASRAGAAGDIAPAAAALLAALAPGELVLFEPLGRGATPRLVLAAKVAAPVERLRALLADPAAYRRAIPAFVRADVRQTASARAGIAPARLITWELEIPLWNLEGQLWLRPSAEGVVLDLVAGDLVPGRLALRALPDGARSILIVDGHVPVKQANFVTRRLAARDPRAEPAMAATAAFVLLRAMALEAEGAEGAAGNKTAKTSRRWPRAAMSAPRSDRLEGAAVASRLAEAGAAGFPLGTGSAVALVRSRADGRLDHVALALPAALPPAPLHERLGQAPRWRALAGWKEIEAAPAPERPGFVRWTVDSSLPFVDFDATWLVRPAPPFRAAIERGDWRGAAMGWDVAARPAGAPTVAVYTLHPRVETTGFLPRKLIEAEPLLEQGLALGLAYVNAIALMAALHPPAAP